MMVGEMAALTCLFCTLDAAGPQGYANGLFTSRTASAVRKCK